MKGKRAATHSAALRASGEPPLQHEHFRCHKKIPSENQRGFFYLLPATTYSLVSVCGAG